MHQIADKVIKKVYGQAAGIQWSEPVAGGDINEAYHLLLADGTEAFLKLNDRAADNFFAAEAQGLKAMGEAGAKVPKVLAYGKAEGTGYLLLEYVRKGNRKANYGVLLGQMLGKMHKAATEGFTKAGRYGFYENNYIGATPQVNTPKAGWVEFFRDNRLGVQMKLAGRCFDKEDRRRCQSLLEHLEDYLYEPEYPSLLHGDLWGGNVMADSQGLPMLIDPAVYVGCHEADLAMTELFGGFSPDFYDAYHEMIPRETGYADRRDIYNLYHLLNHLNLFGGSYLASVRRILKRYVG